MIPNQFRQPGGQDTKRQRLERTLRTKLRVARDLSEEYKKAKEVRKYRQEHSDSILERVISAAFPRGYDAPSSDIEAAVWLGELRGILREFFEAQVTCEFVEQAQAGVDKTRKQIEDLVEENKEEVLTQTGTGGISR